METLSPFDFGFPAPTVSLSRRVAPVRPMRASAFCPSTEELRQSILLLEMNRDGKMCAEDLEMLLGMAYGVDLTRQAGKSWQDFKALCMCSDGLLTVEVVIRAVELGILQQEVHKFSGDSGSCGSRFHLQGLDSPSSADSDSPSATSDFNAATLSNGTEGLEGFPNLVDFMETFNRFDCDHNGVVCAKDLKQALRELTNVEFSSDECKDMIRQVDKNFNGVVELNEFGLLLRFLTK